MDEVKEYWSQRAVQSSQAATTNDIYLRRLEAATLIAQLKSIQLRKGARILDIGCGDGETTAAIARTFPSAKFHGIDFSAEMIDLAKPKSGGERITFSTGDVRSLREHFQPGWFDVIITNRCLINLLNRDEQYDAVEQISACLCGGGYFIGTENFIGGQSAMNALRQSLGLKEIPIRWHNLYFDEKEFLDRAGRLFERVELINFSSTYYLVTRVVYSALCKAEGTEPTYDHPIYGIATSLPPSGDFSPIKLIVAQA